MKRRRHYILSNPHRHGATSEQLRGRRRWGATSAYRGVYQTPEGRYAARIRIHGTLHYCGTHDTQEQAARAVDARSRELLGDGAAAVLNFPEIP